MRLLERADVVRTVAAHERVKPALLHCAQNGFLVLGRHAGIHAHVLHGGQRPLVVRHRRAKRLARHTQIVAIGGEARHRSGVVRDGHDVGGATAARSALTVLVRRHSRCGGHPLELVLAASGEDERLRRVRASDGGRARDVQAGEGVVTGRHDDRVRAVPQVPDDGVAVAAHGALERDEAGARQVRLDVLARERRPLPSGGGRRARRARIVEHAVREAQHAHALDGQVPVRTHVALRHRAGREEFLHRLGTALGEDPRLLCAARLLDLCNHAHALQLGAEGIAVQNGHARALGGDGRETGLRPGRGDAGGGIKAPADTLER
mmetsp:Transcript_8587/g.34987  ORF Transcript_8587/g.34987 Transcript_8587/m.34987 type:complete len:321 (+) Transcript_8587:1624-2586(+)